MKIEKRNWLGEIRAESTMHYDCAMDALMHLQEWYANQCDGDWEHIFGIKIETLDNPGWRLKIDLKETDLEGRAFIPISRNVESESDWVVAHVENGRFEGAGDPLNLSEMLAIFIDWTKSSAS